MTHSAARAALRPGLVPYAHGGWLFEHLPTARRHVHDEDGHLTLVVDSSPKILDELLAAGG